MRFVILAAIATTTACCGRQVPATGGASPASCDSLAYAVASGDTSTLLMAVVELGYRTPETARYYAVYLLEDLARTFRLPQPLAFTAWSGDSLVHPVIEGEARLDVTPDGAIDRLVTTQTTLAPSIDSAWRTAIRAAATGGAVPSPSSLGLTNAITLFVALQSDSMTPLKSATDVPMQSPPRTPEPRFVQRPLLKLRVPERRLSTPVRVDPGHRVVLAYPDSLRMAWREGDVWIDFVVGRDGRAVPGTLRLIGASEHGFADFAYAAIRKAQFLPAAIDGCPVSMYARQPMSFRLRRP